MALYQYTDGEWVQAQRPYVKYAGVYTACKNVWVKKSGVWVKAYSYDTTPPDQPMIGLELYEDRADNGDLKTRYIRVAVRMPKPSHDPEVAMIRVLTDYMDKAPTTPVGQTYTGQSDSNFPGEPWSDWKYGPGFPHPDTSKDVTKQWPRNAGPGTQLKGDKNYHFGAWAQDHNGNWGPAVQHHLFIPKGGVQGPTYEVKEAYVVPNHSGSWKNQSWADGHLLQQKSPRSNGLWLHGGEFGDLLKTTSEISTAQICLVRTQAGTTAQANVYLFWHTYGTIPGLPAVNNSIDPQQIQKLGQISKGETKWFNIPLPHYSAMKNGSLKGFGLYYKDPDKADAQANDFSQIGSYVAAPGSGTVHLVWKDQT